MILRIAIALLGSTAGGSFPLMHGFLAVALAQNSSTDPVQVGSGGRRIHPPCPASGEFRCHSSGRCIPLQWLCDGARDCDDGEDERHDRCDVHSAKSPCFGNQPECMRPDGTKHCILHEWVCDGHPDCTDGSDERDCGQWDDYPTNPNYVQFETSTCSPWEFTCSSGLCISRDALCDDKPDCHDGSDESEERCATPPRVIDPAENNAPNESESSTFSSSNSSIPTNTSMKIDWPRNSSSTTRSPYLSSSSSSTSRGNSITSPKAPSSTPPSHPATPPPPVIRNLGQLLLTTRSTSSSSSSRSPTTSPSTSHRPSSTPLPLSSTRRFSSSLPAPQPVHPMDVANYDIPEAEDVDYGGGGGKRISLDALPHSNSSFPIIRGIGGTEVATGPRPGGRPVASGTGTPPRVTPPTTTTSRPTSKDPNHSDVVKPVHSGGPSSIGNSGVPLSNETSRGLPSRGGTGLSAGNSGALLSGGNYGGSLSGVNAGASLSGGSTENQPIQPGPFPPDPFSPSSGIKAEGNGPESESVSLPVVFPFLPSDAKDKLQGVKATKSAAVAMWKTAQNKSEVAALSSYFSLPGLYSKLKKPFEESGISNGTIDEGRRRRKSRRRRDQVKFRMLPYSPSSRTSQNVDEDKDDRGQKGDVEADNGRAAAEWPKMTSEDSLQVSLALVVDVDQKDHSDLGNPILPVNVGPVVGERLGPIVPEEGEVNRDEEPPEESPPLPSPSTEKAKPQRIDPRLYTDDGDGSFD